MKDFPLFLHRSSGQWCKKVQGRQYYFGSIKADPKGEAALKDWVARKDGILAGLDNLRVESTGSGLTLGEMLLQFTAVIQTRLKDGKIADETFIDYRHELNGLVNLMGAGAIASKIGPAHFTAYHRHLAEVRKLGPHRMATAIRYVRAAFNWATKNGLLPTPIYGTEFVAPDTSPEAISMSKARGGKDAEDDPIFSTHQIDWLLNRATPNFKAMILLTLNTGIGPSDLAKLRWRHIKGCRMSIKRGKNGIKREAYIWEKTRLALAKVRTLKHSREATGHDQDEALIFITRKGLPYIRRERTLKDGKIIKTKVSNAISITVGRWIKEAKAAGIIPVNLKLTYYTLRATFRTHADNCPDVLAVRRVMGRAIQGSDRRYVRGAMKIKRLKRVVLTVKHCIWPMQKGRSVSPSPHPAVAALKPGQMRMVS